jgi:uracil-DNA glycosylase
MRRKYMPTNIPAPLQKFYAKIDNCARCKAEGNPLRHVLGGGKFRNPKFFFLFINPTHKNQSSHSDYEGERRYPFIGVRHLYKGLAEAGFVDFRIVAKMYERGWQVADEHRIEASLRKGGVYISNFVKCARPNPTNPKRSIMKADLPLLARELELVNPRYVVTFGLLPLGVLTGNNYRLRDILVSLKKHKYLPILSLPLDGKRYKILPCYYPLGHGNPPKAHQILEYIRNHF